VGDSRPGGIKKDSPSLGEEMSLFLKRKRCRKYEYHVDERNKPGGAKCQAWSGKREATKQAGREEERG